MTISKGIPGVFTPSGQILCRACHSKTGTDDRHSKVAAHLASLGNDCEGNATTCTSCGCLCILPAGEEDRAAEGELVSLLRKVGFVNARMVQTGGMCSAAQCGDLMAVHDPDGITPGKYLVWISGEDEDEEVGYLSMGQIAARLLGGVGDTEVRATITVRHSITLTVDEPDDALTLAEYLPLDDPLWEADVDDGPPDVETTE